jgi:hypothetical protein
VQKEVATFYSWVLQTAFNSDFIEGQTQTYALEDVDEEVFKLFIQWLYRQKFGYYLTQTDADLLRQPKSHTEEQLKAVKDKIEKRQEILVRLWILGDRLSIPRLQNLVVDDLENIRLTWSITVPLRLLAEVYENTVEESRLIMFLVLHIKSFIPKDDLREHVEVIPQTFLLEYALMSHVYMDWSDRQIFRDNFHVLVTDEYKEEDEEYGSDTGSQGYFGHGFH